MTPGVGLETRASRPFPFAAPVGPAIIEELGQIGMEQAPLEACGIILVGVGLVVLKNHAEDPANNSLFSRDDVVKGVARLTSHLRSQGVTLLLDDLQKRLVFWHTHPGGQEGPSEVDMVTRADQPLLRMMVVSIPSGLAVEY